MTRTFQILLIFVLAAVFSTASPPPAPADDMVLFKNGRTLRADELKLEHGSYRITTMSGGVMEIPVQLVERVIACVVDKEVEEQRGTAPAGSRAPGNTMGGRANATKVPPVGAGGAAGKLGSSPSGGGLTGGGRVGGGRVGGGRAGNAKVIPPRGGKSLGRTGGDKPPPEKGKGEGK